MTKPILTLVAIVLLGVGCIPSEPIDEAVLDRQWTLSPDLVEQSSLYQPSVSGRKLPARWIIRRQDSLVLSTVSIVRATDKLQEGEPKLVEFGISPAHGQPIIEMMNEGRTVLAKLQRLVNISGTPDRRYWAETFADALVASERVARMSDLEDTDRQPDGEPLGVGAGPAAQVLSMFLNERTGGRLLSELDADEVDQLRVVLTQISLRLAFDLAGKQIPEGFRKDVIDSMTDADDLATLRTRLEEKLLEAVEQAPATTSEPGTRQALKAVTQWTPKAFDAFESLINQWHKVDHLRVDIRKLDDSSVVSLTVKVVPGQEVTLSDIVMFQPVLAMRGTTRIGIVPQQSRTGETVISFDPVSDDGAIELRYEGIVYSLARLFAFPLASGPLREIRVGTHGADQGRSMVHVSVLSEDSSDTVDPRRVLIVQDSRMKELVRRPFEVKSIDRSERQVVNYLVPGRRYTYVREK